MEHFSSTSSAKHTWEDAGLGHKYISFILFFFCNYEGRWTGKMHVAKMGDLKNKSVQLQNLLT